MITKEQKYGGAGGSGMGLPWKMTRLMAPAKDPKSSGGNQEEEEEDDDDKFTARVNKVVHAILKERDGRLEKKLTSIITSTVTSAIDGLAEKLKPAASEEEPAAKAPKGGKGEALSPEAEDRLKAAEKKASDADAKLAKLAEKAAKDEARARELEERGVLHEALNGKLKAEVLDMTVGHLRSRLVREVVNEDTGETRLRWKGDDEELVDPAKGISSWLKSPAGLALQPAKGQGGGGTRPTAPKGPDGQPAVMSDGDVGALIMGMGRGQ